MNASVSLQGKYVTAVSPEGAEGKIKIADLLNRSSPAAALVEQLVNPDGCRKIIARGRYAILVHETPPRVRTFKWIARGSDVPYGPEANYTDVSIALPYVVVMAVFECDTSGGVKLTNANECFFSNEPLVSMDQPLSFPALLNCSRFEPPDGHPLSWICTMNIEQSASLARRSAERSPNEQFRDGLRALLHTLLETGFNYSSEHHETNSWWSESSRVDKRIADVDAWQRATAKDKFFVLDLPWLPTKHTAAEIVERIFRNLGVGDEQTMGSADDVARIVLNAASA